MALRFSSVAALGKGPTDHKMVHFGGSEYNRNIFVKIINFVPLKMRQNNAENVSRDLPVVQWLFKQFQWDH